MPSASAKLEKAASAEAADPVKQFTIIMEKKVRNLEKRKGKLDNYKNEVQNGKELNDDQKIAVSKYDQVVEVLEFAKELSKSFSSVILDCTKAQKKLAKKEQIEKQQHEIQRLHEAYSYRHILTNLADDDIRNDFLNGTNGALQLTEKNISELDELCKMVIPHVHSEQPDIENHFHSSAEHMFFLLEGKNKEVAGTNYKNLKELLQSIKESGYFSRSSENAEEEIVSSDETPEVEEDALIENSIEAEEHSGTECAVVLSNTETDSIQEQEKVEKEDDVQGSSITQSVSTPLEAESTPSISAPLEVPTAQNLSFVVSNDPSDGEAPQNLSFNLTNGPLQEVLSTQGSFNFLQESQIDLESPHMDPAVVAAHPMAPPPSLNFSNSVAVSQSHSASSPESQQQLSNMEDVKHDNSAAISVQQQIPVLPTGVTRTIAPVLTSVQHNSAHDFDPSHPIQTQTFTNQSFAVMQNMIIPPAYVPVTMHHGLIPPHIASMAVVPSIPPTVTTPSTAAVPIHVTVASVPVTAAGGPVMTGSEESEESSKNTECQQQSTTNGNCSGPETDASQNGSIPDKGAKESEEFTQGNNYQYRGGYRGRNRGRSSYNGSYRGRGGYNSGRGGYQGGNPYYQRGNGYNGNNYRRNPRGAPRGGTEDRGGSRGNNYRSQQQ